MLITHSARYVHGPAELLNRVTGKSLHCDGRGRTIRLSLIVQTLQQDRRP